MYLGYNAKKHPRKDVIFMKLKEGFLMRQVAGQTVVLPSGDELDLNMMITLNDTGAFLWKQLEQEQESSR